PAVPPATDLVAAAAPGGKASLRWTDASGGKASYVVQRNGSNIAVVQPPLTETNVDLVAGDNCFTVVAQVGDVKSDPSNQQCVSNQPQTTTTTPKDLGIVAVVQAYLLDDPQAQQRAEQKRQELVAK